MTINWLRVISVCYLSHLSFSRYILNSSSRWPFCDTGQYLNSKTGTCRNCTTVCPVNQIIRRTCSAVADSVCGPFFEFRDGMHQGNKNKSRQKQRSRRPHHLNQQGESTVVPENQGWQNLNLLIDSDVNNSATFAKAQTESSFPTDANFPVNKVVKFVSLAVCFFVAMVTTITTLLLRKRRMRKKEALQTFASGPGVNMVQSPDYLIITPDRSLFSSRPIDKSVIHLESQIWRNLQRRLVDQGGASRNFSSSPRGCIGGNDYVDRIQMSHARPFI